MASLFCAIVGGDGHGRLFSVRIDLSETVAELKQKIKETNPEMIRCDAGALTLFLAKRRSGWWLHGDDDDVQAVRTGPIPDAIRVMLVRENEMAPVATLNEPTYFGHAFVPGNKEIHVLVELPSARKRRLDALDDSRPTATSAIPASDPRHDASTSWLARFHASSRAVTQLPSRESLHRLVATPLPERIGLDSATFAAVASRVDPSTVDKLFVLDDAAPCHNLWRQAFQYVLEPLRGEGSECGFHGFWDSFMRQPLTTLFLRAGGTSDRSFTTDAHRPDLFFQLKGVCVFRGEEAARNVDLAVPRAQLRHKLPPWTIFFGDAVPYIFGYAASGFRCALYAISPREPRDIDTTLLLNLDNTNDTTDRFAFVLAVFQLSRLFHRLVAQCGPRPQTRYEFYDTQRLHGMVVHVHQTCVVKDFTNVQAAIIAPFAVGPRQLATIYRAIEAMQPGVPYMDRLESVSRSGRELTFTPRGFEIQPSSLDELFVALRCVLESLQALHTSEFAGWRTGPFFDTCVEPPSLVIANSLGSEGLVPATTPTAPMEAAAAATVSGGPPPGDPSDPVRLNGSIAVTEAHGASPPVTGLSSSVTAGETPQPSAPEPQQPEASAPPPAPVLAIAAPDTSASLDVFADTEDDATPTARSRQYGEDGDAEMAGDEAPHTKSTFTSQLQESAKGTASPSLSQRPKTPPRAPRAQKTPPPAPTKRSPGATSKPRASRPAAAGDRPAHGKQKAPVWSPQGVDDLRRSLGGARQTAAPTTAVAVQSEDEDPALEEYYACARKPSNLRRDGDQREMTTLESTTLFQWMDRRIHLAHPPLFLSETCSSAERDAYADYFWDHLGYRLYGILPPGKSIPDESAKYQFCFNALLSAKDPAQRVPLESMLNSARVITCEAKSRLVVLRFVRPEVRDLWNDLTFPFQVGSVTLRATDSLTTDLPRVGLDQNARKLLYHVFARGPTKFKHGEIRAMFAAAAKMPVLDVELLESVGLTSFLGAMYKITFDQVTCPKALEQLRRLDVTYGDERIQFAVHHPRASRRVPCSKCLSVRHVTKECKTTKVEEGIQRHAVVVNVQPVVLPPKLTAALSPKKLAQQIGVLRSHAAPALAVRLAAEKTARLARISTQAKQRTDRVAREAAAEARLQQALKDQAAAEKARQQTKRSQAAHAATTKQLKLLQAQASRAGRATSRDTTQPSSNARAPASMTAASVCGVGAAVSTTSGVTEAAGQEPPPAPAKVADGTTASAKHDVPGDAIVKSVSKALTGFSSLQSTGKRTAPPSPTTSDEERELYSKYNRTPAPFECAESPIEPEAGCLLELHQHGQTTMSIDAAPSVFTTDGASPIDTDGKATGKRTAPPTPTSSDDERAQYTKYNRIPPPLDINAPPSTVTPAVAENEVQVAVVIVDQVQADSVPANADQVEPVNADQVQDPESRALRQLPLSAFYGPQSLADAQAQLNQELAKLQARTAQYWMDNFPSPALDNLLNALRSPRAIAAWLDALQAREIRTPGTGGCLYFALHLCRTPWKIFGKTISANAKGARTKDTKHTVEANWYKAHVCGTFLDYLEQMLSDGTITLTDLNRRYFGPAARPTDRSAALKAIRTFIADIAKANAGLHLTRSQWGGDAELFSAVWFLREPVFVISEDDEGSTAVRVLWLERPTSNGPEQIVQLFPDSGEAFEMIRCFLHHRVLPTVLLFHANEGNGHFNSLRFTEAFYAEWTADDPSGEAMRSRIPAVLGHLGWYVAPTLPDGIPTTKFDEQPASGSVYEPSEVDEVDLTATPLSPDARLSPPSHFALLSSLNPRRRRRGDQAELWAQAERLNLNAYRMWDAAQQQSEARSDADTVNAGCRYWSAQISQLVALLRALPYPEVAVSLLSQDLVVRLGNELNNLASTGTVPEFVRAEDPVEARRQWARLVAIVVVTGDDDLINLKAVEWLRCHPDEATAALHALRLHDWTVIGTLAQEPLPTQPTYPSNSGSTRGTRS